MQERFAEWVWEDPDRAARLGEEYNRRFNAIGAARLHRRRRLPHPARAWPRTSPRDRTSAPRSPG